MAAVQEKVADRISDKIVAIVNEELDTMRRGGEISPGTLLAGQLLGLMATLSTAPGRGRPEVIQELQTAVERALMELSPPTLRATS